MSWRHLGSLLLFIHKSWFVFFIGLKRAFIKHGIYKGNKHQIGSDLIRCLKKPLFLK